MIWLLGCSPSTQPITETLTTSGVGVVVSSPVLDPRLDDVALSLQATLTGDALPDCSVELAAVDSIGREASLGEQEADWSEPLVFAWSGRDDDGAPFAVGPAQVQATLNCPGGQAIATAELEILRLAPVELSFAGDGHVPLAFHKTSLDSWELTLLDDVAAWTRPVAEDAAPPWADPDRPPWGDGEPEGWHNLPIAQVAGATQIVQATFPPGDAAGHAIQVSGEQVDGWQEWQPDAVRTWTTEPAPSVVGRDEMALTWRFQVQDGEQLVDVPGSYTTTHPRYVVVDTPWVPDGTWIEGSPSVAWVGVLEDVNEAVAGLDASDDFALMDALRDHLHHDTFLVYNPSDSAYSSFDGSYITWNYTWVEMSQWLDRRSGVDLYCHSLACVLSSQANHLGLPAEYVTLAYNFRTNLTRAAGSEDWQQWSFNSHGVVTVDGEHIWDAAVDYDGDDDPTQHPVTPVSAMGVPFDEYLELLTADDIGQVNGGRCFVF